VPGKRRACRPSRERHPAETSALYTVLSSGEPGVVFSREEAAERATMQGRIVERMWDWLTRDETAPANAP